MDKFNLFIISIDKNNYNFFEKIFIHGISPHLILNNSISSNKKIHSWYFKKSNRTENLWNHIKKNDWVIFEYKQKYSFAGKIKKKFQSEDIQNEFRKKISINQSIYGIEFDDIKNLDFNRLKINKLMGIDNELGKMHRISFVKIEDQYVDAIIKKFSTFEKFLVNSQGTTIKKTPSENKKAHHLDSIMNDENPPKSITSKITRKIRSTKKSELLKKKYNNLCQLCNIELHSTKTTMYSEVHHVWPLGKDGKDNFDNMLVLCPNHHTQFDSAFIGFDTIYPELIVDVFGNKVGKLHFISDHKLKNENILYHIEKMEKN